MDDTEHVVDLDVVRGDPADPGEVRERGEDVSREEVYGKVLGVELGRNLDMLTPSGRAQERVQEEAFTAETAAVAGTGVVLRVEGVE